MKGNELLMLLGSVMTSLYENVVRLFSQAWSVILMILASIGAWYGNGLNIIGLIAIAILIDGIFGIMTAIKAKKFLLSILVTKSAVKIFVYTLIYTMVFLIEQAMPFDTIIASSIAAGILIASETMSVLGHTLVLMPNLVAVRLLEKYLKKEMAKKLDMTIEEVEELMYDKRNKHDKTADNN